MRIRGANLVPSPCPGFLASLAVLAALWAYAVGQPLLDLVGSNPQFLGVHGIGRGELALLLGLLLVPAPLAGALLVAGVGRVWRRGGGILLAGLTAALAAAAARPLLGRVLPVPGWIQLALAGLVGLGLIAVLPWSALRGRRLAAPALLPLLLAALFLGRGGARIILFPPSAPATGRQAAAAPALETVVLVVFDALPLASLVDSAGVIDPRLYPRWAEFAADAEFYRNTLAVSPSTLWAVPAILSGRLPERRDQPELLWYPDNIFTWLRPTHDIHAFEPHTRLNPPAGERPPLGPRLALTIADLAVIAGHVLLPADLATALPPVTNDWQDFAAGADVERADHARSGIIARFGAALGSAGRNGRPGCYVLHAMLPHGPPEYLPSGARYVDDFKSELVQGQQWGAWRDDLWAVISMQQRYLAQTLYTDRIVGGIIDRLKEVGLYDRATIAICADHGMAFMPGDGRRVLTGTNRGEILPVPFLIRSPGGTGGRVDDRPLATVDVLPTIAGALGTTLPWADGRDAADPAAPDRPAQFLEKDGWLPVDRGEVRRQLAAAVARRAARFGPTGDGHLFAPVRGASLLGRPVPASLPAHPDAQVALRQPALRRSPDTDAGTVPALVSGAVTSSTPPSAALDVVIAVDDTIRAVTHPFGVRPDSRESLFSSLVPESAVGPGEHRYRVIFAEWSGDGVTLMDPAPGRDE